ncbi:hypothetical protein Ciccas_005889 [Cichlidogyrus casuarinus]|uniref:EGF-like domain-containing protein n=1 Tax=Cichlidogyrus casuarinus TaxID=1844966 RepID=A0ABD2Q7D8_9PLAT
MKNYLMFIFLVNFAALFWLNECNSQVSIEVIYKDYSNSKAEFTGGICKHKIFLFEKDECKPKFSLSVLNDKNETLVEDSVASDDYTNKIEFARDKNWHGTGKDFRKLEFTSSEEVIASTKYLSLFSNIVNDDTGQGLISSESIQFDSILPIPLYEIGEFKQFSGLVCAPHFYTQYCDVFCQDVEHGTCDENGVLVCEKGFKGTKCELKDPCYVYGKPVCRNNGTCVASDEQEFTCKCTNEYLGKTCDIKNPCVETADFCLNGGICVPELDTEGTIYNPVCLCPQSYSYGEHCEGRNYCFTEDNTPMCNEAIKTCTSNADSKSYMCDCKAEDKYGIDCDLPNPCGTESKPYCFHDGQCSFTQSPNNEILSVLCKCPPDYQGERCEICKIDSIFLFLATFSTESPSTTTETPSTERPTTTGIPTTEAPTVTTTEGPIPPDAPIWAIKCPDSSEIIVDVFLRPLSAVMRRFLVENLSAITFRLVEVTTGKRLSREDTYFLLFKNQEDIRIFSRDMEKDIGLHLYGIEPDTNTISIGALVGFILLGLFLILAVVGAGLLFRLRQKRKATNSVRIV